jgi:hypothetical protein
MVMAPPGVVVQLLALLVAFATSTPALDGQIQMQLSLAEAMQQISTLWEITIRIIDFG